MSGGEGIRTREEGSVAKRSGADAGGGPNEREDEGKARSNPFTRSNFKHLQGERKAFLFFLCLGLRHSQIKA